MPRRTIISAFLTTLLLLRAAIAADSPAKPHPLMKDFMGLNGHTIAFRPQLYRPVCELVRDYHNLSWDLGNSPATPTHFPKGEASKASWLDKPEKGSKPN